jgi:hypothetical protein
LAAGVTEAGANEQVMVTSGEAQVNATGKLKPFKEVTITAEVVEYPTLMIFEAGETARV